EGEVVLYAEFFVVGGGWNVEHVFDPVGPVGDLEFVPVRAVVFEAPGPVQAEAEEGHVEAIFGGQVLDDEAGVNEACADLLGGGAVGAFRGLTLNERHEISFRITRGKGLRTVRNLLDFASPHAVRNKVLAKL